ERAQQLRRARSRSPENRGGNGCQRASVLLWRMSLALQRPVGSDWVALWSRLGSWHPILGRNLTCRLRFVGRLPSNGGHSMSKKLALGTAAMGLSMSTASADYYIVQEKATKKCKVVETRPTETTWIQVGPAAFKTQSDADKQIKTVCVEKN